MIRPDIVIGFLFLSVNWAGKDNISYHKFLSLSVSSRPVYHLQRQQQTAGVSADEQFDHGGFRCLLLFMFMHLFLTLLESHSDTGGINTVQELINRMKSQFTFCISHS